MEVSKFVDKLKQLGLSLVVKESNLVLKGIKDQLSPEEKKRIRENDELINYMKEHKEELIKFLTSAQVDSFFKKRSSTVSAMYFLSPLQEGMLFHGLFDPDSPAYIEQMSCTFTNLQVESFLTSWNYLLQQHTILRTSFHYKELSVPVQCVHQTVRLPFTQLDYSGFAPEEQQAQVNAFLDADRKRGFNLTKAPLMRLTLIQLSSTTYKMVWTYHHLLLDGWSLPVLIQKLFTNYQSLIQGGKPVQEEEDRYEDFIRYLENRNERTAEQFWKQYLGGMEEASLLPLEGNQAECDYDTAHYKELQLVLDAAQMEAVQAYAQTYRLTINTVMQGVWAYLLSKYCGRKEVLYGVTVSGRPVDLPGAEQRVGLYINTLPLKTTLDKEQQVVDWLTNMQNGHSQAREYSFSPLTSIKAWSGMKGEWFNSIYVFENYPVREVLSQQWGVQASDLQTQEQTHYPLSIAITSGQQLTVNFGYNSSQVSHDTMQRIKSHFAHVLQQIVTQPNLRLSQLELLTSMECRELLDEFNATSVDYPRNLTLVDMFEAQVENTPETKILDFRGETITYRQLNKKANQLAWYLRAKGVNTETLVPICMERSIELLIGILGILKAGGAYVPLDPAYPEERLQYMLQDTAAQVILTTNAHQHLLTGNDQQQLVLLDTHWSLIDQEPTGKLSLNLRANNLAYVIYTSGSTGKPKGVLIEHSGVVNLSCWHIRFYELSPSSRSTLLAGVGFDALTWELWPALLSGTSLSIISDEQRLNVEALVTFFQTNEITHSFLPTALMADFVQQSLSHNLVLRDLTAAGEQLQPVDVRGLPYQLVNAYGPTENTVCSTFYPLRAADAHRLPPIGKPIANTQVYVLDSDDQLVPTGVIGQLHVGGVQVARGYLNQPELTLERFIPDPFSADPAARLYRTGDLVRWLPEGNLEYVGRIDDQVKIRGYRIELGEIETVLSQCSGVRQAVVVAKEDATGTRRLIGYVVAEGAFDKEALVGQLKSRLPDYMVPAVLIPLQELPLTTNGKVDKKALPLPDPTQLLSNVYQAPLTGTEIKLAEIWQQLLKVDKVGIHDNFFELGGHSLFAIQLSNKIKQAFSIEDFSVVHVFKSPTIEQLAEIIVETVATNNTIQHDHMLLLQPEGNESPIFIVPGTFGISDAYHGLAEAFGKDQPVYGLQMQGVLKGETPLGTIEAIARKNIKWIKTVQPEGPYRLVGHSLGGAVVYEMIRQLEDQEERVEMAVLLDAIPEIKTNDEENRAQLATMIQWAVDAAPAAGQSVIDWQIVRSELPINSFDGIITYVKNMLHEYRIVIENLDALEQLFQVIYVNMHIVYKPQGRINQKLILIKAQESNWEKYDISLGWLNWAKEVHVTTTPGGHHSMLQPENVKYIVEEIRKVVSADRERMHAAATVVA